MRLSLRILISVILLGLVFWYIGGPDQIADVLKNGSVLPLVLAFIVATLDRALMAYKWGLLLSSRQQHLPLLAGMKIYCASMIWGLFLPTTVGADAIRALLARRERIIGSIAIASIIVERMIGFLAALMLGLIGFFLLRSMSILDSEYDAILSAGLACLLGATVAFGLSFTRSWYDALLRLMPSAIRDGKIIKKLDHLHGAYLAYGGDKRIMGVFFSLSLLEQTLAIVYCWLLAVAFDIDAGFILIAGVIPLTLLISRLPISIDAIGVFEGAFAMFMSLGGVPPAAAVSIALSGRVVQIAAWLPWWIAYTIERKNPRPPAIDDSMVGKADEPPS